MASSLDAMAERQLSSSAAPGEKLTPSSSAEEMQAADFAPTAQPLGPPAGDASEDTSLPTPRILFTGVSPAVQKEGPNDLDAHDGALQRVAVGTGDSPSKEQCPLQCGDEKYSAQLQTEWKSQQPSLREDEQQEPASQEQQQQQEEEEEPPQQGLQPLEEQLSSAAPPMSVDSASQDAFDGILAMAGDEASSAQDEPASCLHADDDEEVPPSTGAVRYCPFQTLLRRRPGKQQRRMRARRPMRLPRLGFVGRLPRRPLRSLPPPSWRPLCCGRL